MRRLLVTLLLLGLPATARAGVSGSCGLTFATCASSRVLLVPSGSGAGAALAVRGAGPGSIIRISLGNGGSFSGRVGQRNGPFATIGPSSPRPTTITPEPATLTLLATGLAGLALRRRRRGAGRAPTSP
jgi:PEP-CTERM motif